MRRVCAAVGAATLSLGALVSAASPAGAGPIVDLNTLEPVPPPGADCRENGQWVICQTGLIFEPENEPIDEFALPCGTIHETALDVRSGIRWYSDGKLIKRFVTRQFGGTWSLSPDGAEPTVVVTAHDNWWTQYEVPGDESTGTLTAHGNGFTVQAPGFGVIVHIAGLEAGDEFRGTFRPPEDPEVATELCAALTR